jgi:hypothetical protein
VRPVGLYDVRQPRSAGRLRLFRRNLLRELSAGPECVHVGGGSGPGYGYDGG